MVENIEHIEVDNIEHIEVDEDENSTEGNTFIDDTQQVNTREVKDDKPLLQEVNIISAATSKNAGVQRSGFFTSSYTRIHVHFFGAIPGKTTGIRRCPVILNDHEKRERLFNKVRDAEKVGVSRALKNSIISKKQSSSSSKKPIEDAFVVMERSVVDLKIMRGLCANGIPFNMVSAINKAPAGYKPPSSEKARTVLLDECHRDVEKDLNPIKDTWYTQVVGRCSCMHGAMFMYAEDFSGVEKTGVAIANYLLGAIETVEPSNVLQVVTFNVANCKAAGKDIEKVHKHIFWSPCRVHTLNLIFKDLANTFYWLMTTYKRGKVVVKYFLNHNHALTMFRDNSTLELLEVANTRFASHYRSFVYNYLLNSWRDRVKQGDENTMITGSKVVETIRSEEFWEDAESILAGAKMGEIYEKMDNMLGEIKDVMSNNKYASYYPEVEKILLARWEKMTIPLHCLGFALCLRFYDVGYLSMLAPGGIARKAPTLDKEVSWKRLKEYLKSQEEYRMLQEQFATFHMRKGLYSMASSQMDAVTMDAIDWWSSYGSETPDLANVAIRVLSQPISSSSAERNWSTYSYTHNVKRNRLNSKRADKLKIQIKWDMNPENTNLEGPSTRYEDLQWENLEGDDVDADGNGKMQRMD
uniref:HAT C-terminal dimerisation domain-containing protein n=1 Tax=Lactuca sativa TaxID=4236 RepID=A0A9R1W801_LACSA|nr:hypothetical protein LSAT_V11C300126940 [Lactuca sativa]